MYKETEFLNHEELQSFTCKRAVGCYIPRTKIVTSYHLVKLQDLFKITGVKLVLHHLKQL